MTFAPTGPDPRDDPRFAGVTLLSDRQVCRLLGIGRRTVWTWSRTGDLPAPVQLGRLQRWRLSDLERHIQRQAEKSSHGWGSTQREGVS
ncbi:MAG: DNA-binding protein [Phycisphaerales bacterium]|nr:MAG: DNA-binding protein [Phycisphaerales bacterium]